MHSEKKSVFGASRVSPDNQQFSVFTSCFLDQNKDGVHTATGLQQWAELLPPQQSKQEPAETPKPSLGFPPADHQGAD